LLGPGEYHIYLSNSDFVSSSNQLVPVEDQISMYPNPGSDQLNFATTLMEPVDLIFYNSAGTQVMSAQNVLTGHSVDVSRLNSGIYFVQVLQASGTIQTLKLMISN